MREHWQSDLDDTRRTLKRQEWLSCPNPAWASSFTACTARERLAFERAARRRSLARSVDFLSTTIDGTAAFYCSRWRLGKDCAQECGWKRAMPDQDAGFDYHRYRKLLAEAVDEPKRLALIDVLVEERARDRLEVQRAADRKAATAMTIAKVLGAARA